jgi:glycosyltransferase involved in cell wall biosynthesis
MARLCRRAAAVVYVTERELQRRYPAASTTFEAAYSSIELPASLLVSEPVPVRDAPPYELISVGSMEQMYKGFDVLLQAMAAIQAAGTSCRLTLVGTGRCRPELEELAGRLGLVDTVRFAGHVPRAEVLELVDRSDLFVLASRHEGLPRALIEAMARAKPCIGTATGGIPELLDVDEMVPVEDSQALAGLVLTVLQDSPRRERMIRRNLRKAQAYTSTTLERCRSEFYRQAAARCLPRPRMSRCVSST